MRPGSAGTYQKAFSVSRNEDPGLRSQRRWCGRLGFSDRRRRGGFRLHCGRRRGLDRELRKAAFAPEARVTGAAGGVLAASSCTREVGASPHLQRRGCRRSSGQRRLGGRGSALPSARPERRCHWPARHRGTRRRSSAPAAQHRAADPLRSSAGGLRPCASPRSTDAPAAPGSRSTEPARSWLMLPAEGLRIAAVDGDHGLLASTHRRSGSTRDGRKRNRHVERCSHLPRRPAGLAGSCWQRSWRGR